MVAQHGLEWVETSFSSEPCWLIEPQIDDIKAELRAILKQTRDLEVTFLAQGAFNKLYKVKIDDDALVLRVTLPVDPGSKTESEVATIQYMSRNGRIPVPGIRAYSSSSSNHIGFEWILMDLMPGVPLRDRWRHISWNAKETLVHQVAKYCAAMYQNQHNLIGNAFLAEKTPRSHPPSIGKIVSMQFFWGDHILQDVPRGPFQGSRDWMAARLTFDESDAQKIVDQSEDEDDREDAEDTMRKLTRLRKLLPNTFSTSSEPTMFFHDDLSQQNILVDEAGKLTAIIDWECVSALPLWKACQYPAFLNGRDRDEEPLQQAYERDGEINDLFWEHLLEYELTRLRTYFLEQIKQLEPRWIDVYHQSQRLRDFDLAAQNCNEPFSLRIINVWLDDVEENGVEAQSLEKRLHQ